MFYECSCGFTASSATAFYKHLAASKESGSGHQLTQARYAERPTNAAAPHDGTTQAAPGANSAAPTAAGPQGQTSNASWVDEFLLVDEGGPAAPQAGISGASAHPLEDPHAQHASAPRHGTSSADQTLRQQLLRSRTLPGADLQDVPLRDLSTAPRSWSLTRQRTGSVNRPLLGSPQKSPGAKTRDRLLKTTVEDTAGVVDSDEVELIDHIGDPFSAESRDQGAVTSSPGGAAQAALRMSGTVVNAVVVGLSPWRWFGNSGGGGGGSPAGAASPGPEAGPASPQSAVVGGAVAAPGSAGGVGAVNGQEEASKSRAVQQGTAAGGVAETYYQVPYPAASLDAVHAVRDVLIWRSPWRTSRIFGAGLYMAVCTRQLTKGHDLLQPSTALFALCFMMLLRNVVRQAMANYRRTQQQQQQQQHSGQEAVVEGANSPGGSSLMHGDEVEWRKDAMLMQQRIELMLRPAALGAARYGAALLVVSAGLLSGRRAITSALVAALLWMGMVLGELRIISQPIFWLLCYVVVFTVPAAYYRCRHAMDASVEAALRFVVRVLMGGSRGALLSASGVAAVALAVLPLNFVLRASLAAAAAFAVLLWHAERSTIGTHGGWGGGAYPGVGMRQQHVELTAGGNGGGIK